MNSYLLLGVAVMAIFTYLPRMIPLTFFRKQIHSTFVKSLLYYVPFAVLAALTFPSVFYSTNHVIEAIVGCVVAIYFSFKGKGLVFVAFAAILSVYIASLFLG